MERILVIEDDMGIYQELCTLLAANGYQPVADPPCDLALLDVNLPGENGFERCRKLRQSSPLPIIFLTARESTEDELLGFSVGADDYIRKPYNSAVLLMRIARLLTRTANPLCTVGELHLNLAAMTLRLGEKEAPLTKNESRILYCLMQKPLCTKEEIVEDLWQNSLYVDENTLYVNINRLRDKLRTIGGGQYIRTVRGIGYRL